LPGLRDEVIPDLDPTNKIKREEEEELGLISVFLKGHLRSESYLAGRDSRPYLLDAIVSKTWSSCKRIPL
jgi:hypothetical protein